jgi:hypothetical protein
LKTWKAIRVIEFLCGCIGLFVPLVLHLEMVKELSKGTATVALFQTSFAIVYSAILLLISVRGNNRWVLSLTVLPLVYTVIDSAILHLLADHGYISREESIPLMYPMLGIFFQCHIWAAYWLVYYFYNRWKK